MLQNTNHVADVRLKANVGASEVTPFAKPGECGREHIVTARS